MKQSLIQSHFPSKKPLEAKQVDGDLTVRKRKCPETPSPLPQSSKKPVLSLGSARAEPADPQITRRLLPELQASQTRAERIKDLLSDIKRPTGLSESTQKLLAELNMKRPARPAPSVDDILNSVPAKEKYQGLLVPERELPLPYEYKRLLTLFETCDLILNFMKRRHSESSFPEVRKAVEEQAKLKFSETHLQQILTVMPEAYGLTWLKTTGKEFVLILEFPDSEGKKDGQLTSVELDNRKFTFKEELLAITKQHHETFLKSLTSRPQVNPDRLRCWYHGFDLHAVPSISLGELPPKPTDENVQSIQEFLKYHTARNKMVQSILEEIPANMPSEPTSSPCTGPKTSLSPAILAMVRQKGELDMELQSSPEQMAREARKENLLTLCEMLKAMFATHRTPSMFMESVINKVKMSRKLDVSDCEIDPLLREVADILPGWLTVISTSMGTVLRMEKRTEMLLATIRTEVLKRYS